MTHPCPTRRSSDRDQESEAERGDRRFGDVVLREPRRQRRADHRIGKPGGNAERKRRQRRFFQIGEQPRRLVAPPFPISRRCVHSARSEEHTSELQSLMPISYAFFCFKKKKIHK